MKKEKDADVSSMFTYRERYCGNCGKEFMITGSEWVYKDWRKNSLVYYCSWKCLREAEKKKETKIDIRHKIINMLEQGLSVKEVAVKLQESQQKVLYWKKKMQDGQI